MERKYIYNEDTLSYDTVIIPTIEKRIPGWKFTYLQLIIFTIGLSIGICFGVLLSKSSTPTKFKPELVSPDMCKVGSVGWRDSVFTEYENKADLYLSRDEFEGTPIKGEMLALAAENAYDSTGILLPVELCLAQCQWESGMGLKGRSPKNNPFNIGEYDSGTVMWFDNTFEGVQAYYYFMTTNYLPCKSVDELFVNFTNCDGNRYASANYEEHVPKQYNFIVRWLGKD
jgi:hypothetical protein